MTGDPDEARKWEPTLWRLARRGKSVEFTVTLTEYVRTQVAEAVAEERERCAKTLDKLTEFCLSADPRSGDA